MSCVFFISKLNVVTFFLCLSIGTENVVKYDIGIVRLGMSLAIIKFGWSVMACRISVHVNKVILVRSSGSVGVLIRSVVSILNVNSLEYVGYFSGSI